MNILVFNCGSSSQRAKVYQVKPNGEAEPIANFSAMGVNIPANAEPRLTWQVLDQNGSNTAEKISHRQVAKKVLKILEEHQIRVDLVGHRFVHGGNIFEQTTEITQDTLPGLRDCFLLAPIHNPNSFGVIEVCLENLAGVKQFAVFDTAFHTGMPEASKRYALPRDLARRNGYHKYGFHGLSLQYVSAKSAELLEMKVNQARLILCHLGSGGSSVTAFAEGRSLDTSMGYSPLAGLVMATRCGDLDPGILIDMVRKGHSADEIERMLNTKSGLLALSGFSSDLEEVIARAEGGDPTSCLTFEIYVRRLRHYLGAYLLLLNGADAIVFTDGIGLSSWQLREKVCSDAENLGIRLHVEANRAADPAGVSWIQAEDSRVKLLVLPNDEERVILEEVLKQL